MTDLEIAKNAKIRHIADIAQNLGLKQGEIELYGKYKAKCNPKRHLKAKLILVTAINPTAAGEGKTTVSIGLADALKKMGLNSALALREPSLGPVFGVKGGAAGGGYAQVIPMEDINLHFTGDLHAITAANNLLCALIDNHIFQGNNLDIDTDNIFFPRCTDTNDRALRNVVVGISKSSVKREDNFVITAASEIMAIICVAKDLKDLKEKLGNISVALNKDGKFIYAKDLKAEGAMATLLKDAIKPNLAQTLEGTPAFIHGGPFANIAHGCNSILATYTAMSYADYVVTEAGFGADLGAEKFLDFKCQIAKIEPSAVVIVATVRALKLHGGAQKDKLDIEDMPALKAGLLNLKKHIENIKNIYNKPVIVAINRFFADSQSEIDLIFQTSVNLGAMCEVCDAFAKGGEGGINLAKAAVKACQSESKLKFAYDFNLPIEDKIKNIATKIYGADGVDFSDVALKKINTAKKEGFENLPIIVAKTQYSLSDNAKLLAMPKGFKITVRDIVLKSGAGFIVAICGSVNLMPALPRVPAAEGIDILENGEIKGLF